MLSPSSRHLAKESGCCWSRHRRILYSQRCTISPKTSPTRREWPRLMFLRFPSVSTNGPPTAAVPISQTPIPLIRNAGWLIHHLSTLMTTKQPCSLSRLAQEDVLAKGELQFLDWRCASHQVSNADNLAWRILKCAPSWHACCGISICSLKARVKGGQNRGSMRCGISRPCGSG